jgi:ABC-type multidrug transport system fused ATPase/permease subunit
MYFKYNGVDDYQLKNINLEILPKSKVGIYGRKNSGKTTFVNIVSGLLEPTMGDIKYNGYSIKELNPESLHSVIGYASADNYLFEGTIMENITLGRENVTIDDVNRVIKGLNLEEFIESNKQGLNTVISPTLNYLPSNITIKLLLARATVINPLLLIIDEIFDQIVPEDIDVLIEFLTNKENRWTLIAVTKNKKVLQSLDEVYLFDNGRIINHGTFN